MQFCHIKTRKLIILLTVLVFLSFVSAYDNKFNIDQEINVYAYCIDCSGSAICNYTAYWENGTLIAENVTATNNGNGWFNYSFGIATIENKGEHPFEVFCYESTGEKATESDFFQIGDAYIKSSDLPSGSSVFYTKPETKEIEESIFKKIETTAKKFWLFLGALVIVIFVMILDMKKRKIKKIAREVNKLNKNFMKKNEKNITF